MRRIREIFRKEMRQVLREPRMRLVLFGPPMIQLILFGYAVNLDIENTRLAWLDQDRSTESRELLASFQASRYFTIVEWPARESEIGGLLDRGDVQAAITVPTGFGRDVLRGRQATVQILVDGSNSNTAALVSSYASQIVARFSRDRLADQQSRLMLARGSQSPPPAELPGVDARSRVWFNPDLRSRNFYVPGVVVNIILLVTLMLTSLAIVREKEIGTMEQLMVTPIRPYELIVGKTLPFALVGLIDLGLITTVAMLVFRIPFRGSVFLLVVCGMLFLLTTLGAGLFISTISQTQQQAVMATFFFAMPAIMLSGFAFPIANMPYAIRILTYLDPMRYFMEIVRGIFLKGVGAEVLWPQMLSLLVYGVAVLTLSVARFHKHLD